MVRIKFHLGLKFWLNGREYEIDKRLSNGDFQVIDIAKGVLSTYSESSLCKLFFENQLKFYLEDTGDKTKKDYLLADFSQLDSDLKAEARRRFKYIQCFLESEQKKRTESSLQPIINKVSQELADNKPPHWSTLNRWIKKYEFSEGDIRSLIPNNIAKGRKSQLHSEVLSIIQQVIDEYYLTLEKPSVSSLYLKVVFEITQENAVRQKIGLPALEIPAQVTIYRIVNKLDPYKEMVARYGKAAADKMFNTCTYLPPNTMRPLEIVEIDHTKLPLYVVDLETSLPIGIPTLTTAVDRYTGMPIGYYISFEPASYLSVMHCLWHSIQPKHYVQSKFPSVKHTWPCYGLMSALKTDNAPEFKGVQLEDACELLFIDLDYAPPKLAWYKAKVERFFRTISTITLQGQPGSFLKFMKKYDDEYDPKKSAVISIDSLNEILHLFIIDIVGQMPHTDFGIPRVDVWLQGISKYPPLLPANINDLRILLGAVTYRVISQNGIEFEGLYYRSPELTRLRHIYEQRDKRRTTGRREREKAKIKYDPTNISFIYVFDPDSHNFVAIPAVDQNYTSNLSLWQHKVIKRLAYLEAQQVDIVALSIAKQKIQDIVKRDWSTTNRGRTKTSMARWLGIGRDGLDTSDVEAYHEEQIAISNQNSLYTKTYEGSYTNQVNGFGEIFSVSLLNDKCFTICPACLALKPYYPKVWDLRYVTVCPYHKCRLVDSCPVCGQIINLSSPNFVQCKKCNFYFNDWFEKCIFEEWLLSAYIYQQVSISNVDSVLSRFHKANPDFLPPFFAIPFLSIDALKYLTHEDIYFLDNSNAKINV